MYYRNSPVEFDLGFRVPNGSSIEVGYRLLLFGVLASAEDEGLQMKTRRGKGYQKDAEV